MGHMSYDRICDRRRRLSRGFRLQRKRCSVLRVRFISYFIRFFCKWKFPYLKALKILLKRGTVAKRSRIIMSNIIKNRPNSQERMISTACSSRSYNQINSFHSEAISDCLEFIKMSAISADGSSVANSLDGNWGAGGTHIVRKIRLYFTFSSSLCMRGLFFHICKSCMRLRCLSVEI